MLEYIALGAGLFGLDTWLKDRVEKDKTGEYPRDLGGTKGKIRIHRAHNPEFSFAFLNGHPKLVQYLPLILTSASGGILLRVLSTPGERKADQLAYTLITAGTASNLRDRLTRGYVVDYIQVNQGPLGRIVFNLGDVCIAAGTALAEGSALVPRVGTASVVSAAVPARKRGTGERDREKFSARAKVLTRRVRRAAKLYTMISGLDR